MKVEVISALQQQGLPASSNIADNFVLLYRLLNQWNDKFNLTALTDEKSFIYKHIVDSLLLARYVDFQSASIIDVGTGAGFPGIPLKVAYPRVNLYLLESVAKKVSFLHHACAQLDIEATIIHSRAEQAGRSSLREQLDFAVARAVAPLAALCEYCLPLLKVGGIFLALKGPGLDEEMSQAVGALEILGGSVEQVYSYSLPQGDQRHLVVIRKLNFTPDKYPRRPGMPTKRPINC